MSKTKCITVCHFIIFHVRPHIWPHFHTFINDKHQFETCTDSLISFIFPFLNLSQCPRLDQVQITPYNFRGHTAIGHKIYENTSTMCTFSSIFFWFFSLSSRDTSIFMSTLSFTLISTSSNNVSHQFIIVSLDESSKTEKFFVSIRQTLLMEIDEFSLNLVPFCPVPLKFI